MKKIGARILAFIIIYTIVFGIETTLVDVLFNLHTFFDSRTFSLNVMRVVAGLCALSIAIFSDVTLNGRK
jgi:hypothetical protein